MMKKMIKNLMNDEKNDKESNEWWKKNGKKSNERWKK